MPKPKPRGAPAGNTNALKHGFYARKLPPSERKAIPAHDFTGLDEEIAIVRLFIQRVLAASSPDATLEENLEILRVISHAVTSLARAVRVNHLITPEDNSFGEALQQALANVNAEIEARQNQPEPEPEPEPRFEPLTWGQPKQSPPHSPDLFRIEFPENKSRVPVPPRPVAHPP